MLLERPSSNVSKAFTQACITKELLMIAFIKKLFAEVSPRFKNLFVDRSVSPCAFMRPFALSEWKSMDDKAGKRRLFLKDHAHLTTKKPDRLEHLCNSESSIGDALGIHTRH